MTNEDVIRGPWEHVSLLKQNGGWSVVHMAALTSYGPLALKVLGCRLPRATGLTLEEAKVAAVELDKALHRHHKTEQAPPPAALLPPTSEELERQTVAATEAAKAKRRPTKLKQGGLW